RRRLAARPLDLVSRPAASWLGRAGLQSVGRPAGDARRLCVANRRASLPSSAAVSGVRGGDLRGLWAGELSGRPLDPGRAEPAYGLSRLQAWRLGCFPSRWSGLGGLLLFLPFVSWLQQSAADRDAFHVAAAWVLPDVCHGRGAPISGLAGL